MKKTQFTDAIREIQKRFVSFLSIILIVMLGASTYFVTSFMSNGFADTGTNYYNQQNYMDLQMISSLGVSEEGLNKVKALKEVKDVEGLVQLDGKLGKGNDVDNVVILTRTYRINIPELIEGSFPDADNECALANDTADLIHAKVGDKVELNASFNDESVLLKEEYTVTGIYNHPAYIRAKSIYTVLIDDCAIDENVMHGLYTRVLIDNHQEVTDTFDAEYFDDLKTLREAVKGLLPELKTSSIEFAKKIAFEKIEEKREEIQAQLDEAQAEIDENKKSVESELAKARKEITDGENKLKEGFNVLDSTEKQLAMGESEFKKARARYNTLKGKVDEFGIDVNWVYNLLEKFHSLLIDLIDMTEDLANQIKFPVENRDKLIERLNTYKGHLEDIADVIDQIQEVVDGDFLKLDYIKERIEAVNSFIELLEKNTEGDVVDGSIDELKKAFINNLERFKDELSIIDDALSKISQFINAPSELAKAEQQIADGRYKLSLGWIEYEEGKAKLESALKEFNSKKKEAEAKLEEAQNLLNDKAKEAEEEIEKAKKEYDNLKCNYILTDRRAEICYNDLLSNVRAMRSSGKVFGSLLGIVSALVCFSTLVIIIEDEKKNVGTAKAFGFKNNEILGKFLIFGTVSVLLGGILSYFVSVIIARIMQDFISNIGMYTTGRAHISIDYMLVLRVIILSVIAAAVVTIIACTGLLKSPASVLMKGQTVSSRENKKKEDNSKAGSLYSRLIIRNMINDKARVIISIIIVAGSVLVMGTGFSLKDSFGNMLKLQTEKVDEYDFRIDLGASIHSDKREKIEEVLKNADTDYLLASYNGLLYLNNEIPDGVNVLVTDNNIANFINVVDPDTGNKIAIPDEGMLVQLRLAENTKLKKGDSLTIYDHSLEKHDVSYSGTFNNYIGRMIIMSKKAYKDVFGKDARDNCYYVKLNKDNYKEIKGNISAISSDVSYFEPENTGHKFESVLSLYNVIILFTLLFAIIMSFIILTNLASIFILRKKKELIVMRINGFSIKKTKEYLSKEVILTTIMGLILGVGLGAVFIKIIIKAMEQPDAQFDRTFNPKAWLIAALIEAIFALIIYYVSFKKVEKLNFREVA